MTIVTKTFWKSAIILQLYNKNKVGQIQCSKIQQAEEKFSFIFINFLKHKITLNMNIYFAHQDQ